jgi:hypothetical protein
LYTFTISALLRGSIFYRYHLRYHRFAQILYRFELYAILKRKSHFLALPLIHNKNYLFLIGKVKNNWLMGIGEFFPKYYEVMFFRKTSIMPFQA